jgi:hypothetical protein
LVLQLARLIDAQFDDVTSLRTVELIGPDTTLVILPTVGHRLGLDLGAAGGQALISFLDRVLGPGIRPDRVPLP